MLMLKHHGSQRQSLVLQLDSVSMKFSELWDSSSYRVGKRGPSHHIGLLVRETIDCNCGRRIEMVDNEALGYSHLGR